MTDAPDFSHLAEDPDVIAARQQEEAAAAEAAAQAEKQAAREKRAAQKRQAQADAPAAEAAEPAFNGAPPSAFDHDADGRPGGSLPRYERHDPKTIPHGFIEVKVTKMGAGKISTGNFDPALGGQTYFRRGEYALVPLATGQALEERGFAEMEDED